MGTISLPKRNPGAPATADNVNDLHTAITNELVPRVFSGTTSVPQSGQDLGTLAYQWNNIYAKGLIINGQIIDFSGLISGISSRNGVVSGISRTDSLQPQFIDPNGAALSATLLANAEPLVYNVNGETVTRSGDLPLAGLQAAPSTNNTADIDDIDLIGTPITKYLGEERTVIPIDNAGSEITSKIGDIAAFQHGSGEIFIGYINSATEITNVYRGYFFDSALAPIPRETISDNDVITLMNIGWVFMEDNAITHEVTYFTPVWSFIEPASPDTGQYWYDMNVQSWKRYDGADFVVIDRTFVGYVIMDDIACIAARSTDLIKAYSEFSNFQGDIKSATVVGCANLDFQVSVYGQDIVYSQDFAEWDITTDLESPQVEAIDTEYYMYVGTDRLILSDIRPYERLDLQGNYHPYHTWRCVGVVYNDGSSDLVETYDLYSISDIEISIFTISGLYQKPSDTVFADVYASSGGGGGGGGASSVGGAGGGGAASGYIRVIEPSNNISITVGGGGGGGSSSGNGGGGGSTSFSTLISLTAGGGGFHIGPGGGGGVATVDPSVDIFITNNGVAGGASTAGGVPSGAGGNAGVIPIIGGEGLGGASVTTSNGNPGGLIGGGGSGGEGGFKVGGSGARGEVRVDSFKRARLL